MTREGTDPRPPGLLLRIRTRSCRFCLVATILVATGSQAGDRQRLPEGFSLADPIWLEGEISSTLCQRLHFRGRPLGLIAFEMPAGDGVVFEECRQYAEGLGGSVGWFVSMPQATEFVPLDLEGLGGFSNPTTCGPRIAYWGSEEIPNDKPYKLYSAYVADVPSRRLLCRQVAGRAWVGTDNPGHLRPARWSEDCSEVLMVEDRYFQPIRLSLPPVETERMRSPVLEASTPSGGIACTRDSLEVIYVDDDAWPEGDGSIQSPLRTLAEALRLRKLGDTIRLLPGRYEQSLELVDSVTIRGSGADWTVVAGSAYRGLAVAPFHTLGEVPAFVELENFILEAPVPTGDEGSVSYRDYDASTLSVLLKMVNAIDDGNYPTVWTLLRRYPGLASMRYLGSGSTTNLGDTLLHRGAYERLDGVAEMLERRFRTRRLIMGLLIDAGADVNAQGGSPYYAGDGVTGTPLHVAVARNRPALAELLLEHGADVDALDSAGYTSLERAAGNREMMALLLSHGAEHDDDR